MSDSDDSTYYNSADEEEREDFLHQLSKYKKALDKFCEGQDAFEKAILVVSQLGWKERRDFVLDGYDALLIGLDDRPKQLKMGWIKGINELECFSNAICIGWKLWPDWWMGLDMMVEYLAENTRTEDIRRLEKPTLLTLKEIALCTVWLNNTTRAFLHPFVRMVVLNMLMGTSSMMASLDSDASKQDPRRICSRTTCTEVETSTTDFKKCGKCKTAFYCSRRCQVKSWKSEHKINCT